MTMVIGQHVYDQDTGDRGRVVAFTHDNQPIAETPGGRLFRNVRDVRGFRPLSKRYAEGDLKVCNCARCEMLLLGSAHADELARAKEMQQAGLGELPPLVHARVNDKPYCEKCSWKVEQV